MIIVRLKDAYNSSWNYFLKNPKGRVPRAMHVGECMR